MSFCDKIANGSVIMVLQAFQQGRPGCGDDGHAVVRGSCTYFRWAVTLVPAGAAALSLCGLTVLYVLHAHRRHRAAQAAAAGNLHTPDAHGTSDTDSSISAPMLNGSGQRSSG